MENLTSKQERSVNECIRTLNFTQSTLTTGYSPKTAYVRGCRLLVEERTY